MLARNRIWLQIEAEIQFDDSTESKQVCNRKEQPAQCLFFNFGLTFFPDFFKGFLEGGECYIHFNEISLIMDDENT